MRKGINKQRNPKRYTLTDAGVIAVPSLYCSVLGWMPGKGFIWQLNHDDKSLTLKRIE